MTDTDRTKIKKQEAGVYATSGAANVATEVTRIHTRTMSFLKTGTENAATNVAEAPMFAFGRKAVFNSCGITVASNVASDNTDYVVIKFYQRTSGAASGTLVGSWNTHGGAQGALTFGTVNRINNTSTGLVTNSDAIATAPSFWSYEILKYGAGKSIPAGTVFTHGLEEV